MLNVLSLHWPQLLYLLLQLLLLLASTVTAVPATAAVPGSSSLPHEQAQSSWRDHAVGNGAAHMTLQNLVVLMYVPHC